MAEARFSVSWKGRVESRFRNARGQMTSEGASEMNIKMLGIAQRMTDELRVAGAQAVRKSLVRPHQSEGHLERATADQRNTYYTSTQIAIGRPQWLDKSQAKYWRQIEYGFTGHVGRPIWVYADGKAPNNRGERDANIRSRNPASTASKPWAKATVIRRPIKAHDIYSELANTKRPRINDALLRMSRQYLTDLGLGPTRVR